MIENFRNFETGPDPFGRSWQVSFRWQQNGISIRHADTVDVKWDLASGEEKLEKVVALPLPLLMKVSAQVGHPITDAFCMKVAGLHLMEMIATWEDMDKELVTLSVPQMEAGAVRVVEAEKQLALG